MRCTAASCERKNGMAFRCSVHLPSVCMARAWAEGDDLASIARRTRLQEGDLVGALQKTLDLISQLRAAALKGPLGTNLVPLLDEADGLLRRGVVQASYTWAVRGPPDATESGDD